jgi:hypothetical protein
MIINHIGGILKNPAAHFEAASLEERSVSDLFFGYILILAAIPPIAGLIGTTQFGWSFAAGATVKLTFASALKISIAYYLAILVAIYTLAKLIQWISRTYGGEQSLERCLALTSYTATPMFLIGALQIYPVMWLNYIAGLPVLAYTVYLLYIGTPIMMRIPREQGFLFASAILAVGMVALIGLLASTVMLWSVGIQSEFTR